MPYTYILHLRIFISILIIFSILLDVLVTRLLYLSNAGLGAGIPVAWLKGALANVAVMLLILVIVFALLKTY